LDVGAPAGGRNTIVIFANAALDLHRAGLNVIPIRPGTKKPAVRHWRRWERERQTARDLDLLRRRHPDADVAFVLGGPGLSLVDFDVDDGERGEADLRALGLPIPATAEYTSPGDPAKAKAPGRHLLLEAPSPPPPVPGLMGHVEFRSTGQYTVAPPSIGRAWTRGLEAIAPMPAEWREVLAHRKTSASDNGSPIPREAPPPPAAPPDLLAIPVLLATDLLATGCAGRLREIERMPEFLQAAARVVGLPTSELGRSFRCVLHPDEHPSVTLWRRDDGTVHYHDRHIGQVFTLAEVFAARVSGQVRHLHGPELATWKLRLLVDARLLPPAPVEAPPLPADAPHFVRQVYAGFLRLLSVKWLHTPGAPSPFTWKFAARWCNVAERQAGAAIRELLRLGVVRIVGMHERTALFLPGGGN